MKEFINTKSSLKEISVSYKDPFRSAKNNSHMILYREPFSEKLFEGSFKIKSLKFKISAEGFLHRNE